MHRRSHIAGRPTPFRGGFTLLEVIIVLMIVAMVAGIVAPAVSGAQKRLSVDNSRNAAISLSARARALAANRGTTAVLEFDSDNDLAWVRMEDDTLSDGRIDFASEYGTDLDFDGNILKICYSSKGYALFSCSSAGLPTTLTFSFGSNSGSVIVRPLGQIERDE